MTDEQEPTKTRRRIPRTGIAGALALVAQLHADKVDGESIKEAIDSEPADLDADLAEMERDHRAAVACHKRMRDLSRVARTLSPHELLCLRAAIEVDG